MLHCLTTSRATCTFYGGIIQFCQVFSKVWAMYYKATTLHRPESRALEIEILSRGSSSLLHPPSAREAGSRLTCLAWFPRNQYGWGIWILHPSNRWRWAWFVTYFRWIIYCLIPVPYYLSFGDTQKRLKLERLTLQKVEYKGLSVERRQKAEMT